MDTIEFNAQNIKCMGCVNAIREGLALLAGVDSITVDLQKGHVTVTGRHLNEAMLTEKMAALGYPRA